MVNNVEKSDLYYIVLVGTNDRALTQDTQPLIARPEAVDDTLNKAKDLAESRGVPDYKFEAITIEEYERIFTEEGDWWVQQSY